MRGKKPLILHLSINSESYLVPTMCLVLKEEKNQTFFK